MTSIIPIRPFGKDLSKVLHSSDSLDEGIHPDLIVKTNTNGSDSPSIQKQSNPLHKSNPHFGIERSTGPIGAWTVGPVVYREKKVIVQILDSPLMGGAKHNQQYWLTTALRPAFSFPPGFIPAPADLIHAVNASLYVHHHIPTPPNHAKNIESLRKMLETFFINDATMTTSQIDYIHASTIDHVVHNVSLPDQSVITTDALDGNGWHERPLLNDLTSSREYSKRFCAAVLGDNDLDEITKIYTWLMGFSGYSIFLDPSEKVRDRDNLCAVVMGSCAGLNHGFHVNAKVAESAKYPALGYRIVREVSP